MHIDRVDVIGVEVPLKSVFKDAYSVKSVQRSGIVRIVASNGVTGLGNIDPAPGYSQESVEQSLQAIRQVLAPLIVGLDPTNVHAILLKINAALEGHLDAKAAIEMACVDLAARSFGVTVHAYLGGAIKDRVLFNAWIGMLPAHEAAAEAQDWQRRGFRSAKLKVGDSVEAVHERVRAVRAAVGDSFNLRIDANGGYDVDTSIRLVKLLAPYKLQLFEQPVAADDLDGMARVRRIANDLGIAIMADESLLDHPSLLRIIEAKAADLIKLKVAKQGGFLQARHMIATAEAAGMGCVIGHGFGLGISTMAEIMLAATCVNVLDGLECVGPLKLADDVVKQSLDLGSGVLALPPGRGLAVEIDEQKLALYQFD